MVALADILFEEWIFLNSESWLVSRFKKQFETFLQCAKVSFFRLSEKTVRQTLKKNPNSALHKFDYLRAFAKWIAVGETQLYLIAFPLHPPLHQLY